jgi:hypothetical protein
VPDLAVQHIQPACGKEKAGTRFLTEDFEYVPYDAIPEYDKLVPRVVTLNSMMDTLNAHKYVCMADFVEDFYQLLNNARTVTAPGSVVRSLYCYLPYCVACALF